MRWIRDGGAAARSGAGTGRTLPERARERNGNLRPAARFLRISRRTPSTGCALRSGGVDCRALPPNPENAVQHTPFHVRNDPPPATVHPGPAPSSSPGPAFARSSRNCVTLRETKPLREASVRDGLRGGAGDGGGGGNRTHVRSGATEASTCVSSVWVSPMELPGGGPRHAPAATWMSTRPRPPGLGPACKMTRPLSAGVGGSASGPN